MGQPVPDLHAVVLAGGSGHRLWPLSRELRPKQLLDLFGTRSLICEAIERIRPLVGTAPGSLLVVCGPAMRDEVRNHLSAQTDPAFAEVGYLVEPVGRNTAPAIALAAAHLEHTDEAALMTVLPSDHLLRDDDVWDEVVRCAAGLAAAGKLVTIGIRPTRPETGYGYIKVGPSLPAFALGEVVPHEAERFVEKPDHDTAESFLSDGGYLWNAGIFVMGAKTLLDELTATGADGARIVEVCRGIASGDVDPADFADLPSVPIDTAVMEVSDCVTTVPADIDWSDVGSLLALERLGEKDDAGNVLVGRAVDVDSKGTVVYAPDRLVATVGLEDVLVVDTEDATLVCPKDRAQDVRKVVEALREISAPEAVEARSSLRPWGAWSVLMEGDGFKIKKIEVNPDARLSLQRHAHRSEHWVVVQGVARVECSGKTIDVEAGQSTYIPVGQMHRLTNPGTDKLVVIEVQNGEYLGEDDIERFEDDWARTED